MCSEGSCLQQYEGNSWGTPIMLPGWLNVQQTRLMIHEPSPRTNCMCDALSNDQQMKLDEHPNHRVMYLPLNINVTCQSQIPDGQLQSDRMRDAATESSKTNEANTPQDVFAALLQVKRACLPWSHQVICTQAGNNSSPCLPFKVSQRTMSVFAEACLSLCHVR